VEGELYDPPQDDPPQGDVPENEASGSADPPADLQEARRAAKERYQLVAEALKREACVRRHYTHSQSTSFASRKKGALLIVAARLTPAAAECLQKSHVKYLVVGDGRKL
jgi:hypothetical protein